MTMNEGRTGLRFWRGGACLALALLVLACDEQGGARSSGLDGAAAADGSAADHPAAASNGGKAGAKPTSYVAVFASSSPVSLDATAGGGGTGAAPQPIVAPYGISLLCGDAILGADEECDDGPGNARDACNAGCKAQDQPVVALAPALTFDRYLGAGRHPVAGLASGFATTYMEVGDADPTVAASLFNIWGQPTRRVTVSEGASPVDDANPVVAALPNGSFTFAWSDFDGDGSDLGVALRQVSADGTLAPLRAANGGTEFSQLNPDILWTGSEVVVAWEDYADANNGPDIRYRTFDADLNPTSEDVTLAGSGLPEAAVSLTEFNGGWAAAYREGLAWGNENIVVRVGDASFRVGPFQGGPLDDRPALVRLDATHLLVVFSVGTDPGTATGVFNVQRLRSAVIDVAGAATQASQALAPLFDPYTTDLTVSQLSPSLAPAPDGSAGAFVSWRSEARPGDEIGDQIWLKFVGWNGATATLTATEQESPIPRPWAENLGDQRRPQLAAVGLPPSGALAIAWDDYSHSQGVDAGNPDVVVRYAPRGRGATGHSCTPVTAVSDAPIYVNVYTAVPGANVVWTANATCTVAPQYQFYFRSPSGVLTLLRDWSTTSTYTWNTTGLALGVWNMQVWVRDMGYSGSPAYQAYIGRVFELNASAACTSVSTTATPSPVVKGTTVTLASTAGSCPIPQFQVSHLAPGSTYQIESAYAAANSTYLWNTTNAAIGTHFFQIWARTQGSVVGYQAYSSFGVKVTAPPP